MYYLYLLYIFWQFFNMDVVIVANSSLVEVSPLKKRKRLDLDA